MKKTVCNERGCPEFAVTRGRCAKHQLQGAGNTSWGSSRDRGAQARFRRAVLKAAGHRCQAIENGERCPVTGAENLHAHHTQPGNDDPATGAALCERHDLMIDPHARPRRRAA